MFLAFANAEQLRYCWAEDSAVDSSGYARHNYMTIGYTRREPGGSSCLPVSACRLSSKKKMKGTDAVTSAYPQGGRSPGWRYMLA